MRSQLLTEMITKLAYVKGRLSSTTRVTEYLAAGFMFFQSFSPKTLLILFLVLRLLQHAAERFLAHLNQSYYSDKSRQKSAQLTLGMSDEDLNKTIAYTNDKYRFSVFVEAISLPLTVLFLTFGGLGLIERTAQNMAATLGSGTIVEGLLFFGILGFLGFTTNLPFDYFRTFVIEKKHGFNRQTVKGFWLDTIKGIGIACVLGGVLLSALLWIMAATGKLWWIWAWITVAGFSLLTAWIYPSLLAPLFNKFSRISDPKLNEAIENLAKKVNFRTSGIFVMDASKRSSHGNAYFTGVFGEKRIVLFDTLLQTLSISEIVAVLAHELGHFKLNHVRWALIRGIASTGLIFWLLSLALPQAPFYAAFGLSQVSHYGALVVFSLWMGILDFFISPINHWISRRNEFAADAFALKQIESKPSLGDALLKLREKSHAMPLSHPWYSSVYHSHPPLLERLKAMSFSTQATASEK